jgi:hypothetical protein
VVASKCDVEVDLACVDCEVKPEDRNLYVQGRARDGLLIQHRISGTYCWDAE